MLPEQKFQDIDIGIDRIFARKLFTSTRLDEIEEEIGESLRVIKTVSLVAFVGAPLLILVSCALFIKSFGWWAFIGAPALFFIWLYYKSLSARGGAGLGPISYIVIAVLINTLFGISAVWEFELFFLLPFVIGLWLERFLYCYTTSQTRNLIVRNSKAFEMFRSVIVLGGINTPSGGDPNL